MILITGASGYVGANLLKALSFQKDNFNVKCLLRTSSKNSTFKNTHIVYGDILDKESLSKALRDVKIIIHIAATINPKKLQEFNQVNYIGTKNIIEYAKKTNTNKIVFLSSYDATADTVTYYGASKKKAEALIVKSGIDYVILRPTVIYGGEKDYAFSKIVSLIKKIPFVPLIGSGHQLLQPVYIEDLIKIIILSLENRYNNRVYNIAGPEKLSQRDIINITAKCLNKKVTFIPIPKQIFVLTFKILSFSNKGKIALDKTRLLSSDKTTDIEEMKKDFNISLTKFSDGIKSIC